MQRRKFLIGMGALTAGSAAAMGTGAFTEVIAQREISINVVGDGSAYLRLAAEDSPNGNEYVDESGDAISLNFDSVNTDADTKFANLFLVENQGTQAVRVGIDHDHPAFSDGLSGVGFFCEGPENDGSLHPKSGIQPGHDEDDSGDDNYGGTDTGSGSGFDFNDDPVHLEPGEAAENVAVAWDANDVNFNDLEGDHTVVIRAESLQSGQP